MNYYQYTVKTCDIHGDATNYKNRSGLVLATDMPTALEKIIAHYDSWGIFIKEVLSLKAVFDSSIFDFEEVEVTGEFDYNIVRK